MGVVDGIGWDGMKTDGDVVFWGTGLGEGRSWNGAALPVVSWCKVGGALCGAVCLRWKGKAEGAAFSGV